MRDQRKCIRAHISTLDVESTTQWAEQIFPLYGDKEIKTFEKDGVRFKFSEDNIIFLHNACINTPSIFCCHNCYKHTYDVNSDKCRIWFLQLVRMESTELK